MHCIKKINELSLCFSQGKRLIGKKPGSMVNRVGGKLISADLELAKTLQQKVMLKNLFVELEQWKRTSGHL